MCAEIFELSWWCEQSQCAWITSHNMQIYIHTCVYIYIYTHVCMYICIMCDVHTQTHKRLTQTYIGEVIAMYVQANIQVLAI
jgi:hypothetical protein